MTRWRALAVVAPLVLAALGLAACSDGEQPGASASAPPSYLYSLSAGGAGLRSDTQGRVTVTMTDTDPHAVWFTDRPVRDSGVMSTADLVERWAPGSQFAAVPPNVALVLHDSSGSTDTVVGVMTDPSYDPGAKVFEMQLAVLSVEEAGSLDGFLAAHGDRHDGANLPAMLGGVSLFIDPEIGLDD